ncbi:MAG TPA: FAD-binding protein [Devosiaceae bacterium]
MSGQLQNWAGNIAFAARAVHTPGSVPELQEIVRKTERLRPFGSRHSFNRIADTTGDLVSTRRLDRIIGIDQQARTVTIEGGVTYGQLCPAIEAHGLALRNLASLPHISVAGAVATATHGSGVANQSLASAVSRLRIVTASGDLLTLSRGDPDFDGAVVSLGALGIVAELTLDLVPSFTIRQHMYLDLPLAAAMADFDAIMSSGYSVSMFTSWRAETVDKLLVKSLGNVPVHSAEAFGAKPADRKHHLIPGLDPTPCTEQMGIEGPWHERLAHFRMDFTPSAGDELQSEYFISRSDAAQAIAALHDIQHVFSPVLAISEIRTIAADELWMSPLNGRDAVAFHFTWRPDWDAVRKVLPLIERQLAPYEPTPHWGKLFEMAPGDIAARYLRLPAFRALVSRHDPGGKFRNMFLDRYVFGE